jgi:MoaA/NifB/PqqE/SkfB family radical SAM enzyme
MAAVSGPTQESTGPLFPVADTLPPCLTASGPSRPGELRNVIPSDAPEAYDRNPATAEIGLRKREVNSYLPAVAASYARNELGVKDLAVFFQHYAHLYTVGIDTNAVCNLSCGYCYLDSYNQKTVPLYADLARFQRLFEEVVDAGVDLIALVGKEPFADDRGVTLLRFLNGLWSHSGGGFRYGVVTNGTLIDRYLDVLPKSLAYVDISLDGPEQINDAVRGDGVFRRAGRNMRELADRSFDVWTSSVLHAKSSDRVALSDFIRRVVEEYGCSKFYFSPVRNFTGSLHPFLMSFDEISRAEDTLVNLAERIPGVETVILDHPYEAVWRDYFWPLACGRNSCFQEFVTDEWGNVLRQMSSRCFQKLDIFPHGPWGTCRVDAQGTYLADVESRTYSNPKGVGSVVDRGAYSLFAEALRDELTSMLERFLANMQLTSALDRTATALTSVSIPVAAYA